MRWEGGLWEGPVGQWLRVRLRAVGIDAPAYGRYVLSLLTRPLELQDLSPETVQNKNWDRRPRSELAPVKLEAMKRSAAVQFLVNASDDQFQSSGIEQLVDELCGKLKEVEQAMSVGGAGEGRRERVRAPQSPHEMARLYYAAFPALGARSTSTSTCHKPCLRPPHKQRRNTVHARTHPHHKKLPPRSKDREPLPEWVTDGDVWTYETQDHLKDLGKAPDEGYGTCDNTAAIEDYVSSKRLYERDYDDPVETILGKDWVIEETDRPRSPTEEECIARFEAKFDSSLEALWAKEQNNTPDDEYQELPVDFQDLLSSPSDAKFPCMSPDKPAPLSLTASIWSNSEPACDKGNMFSFQAEPSHSKPSTSQAVGADTYNRESMEVIYKKLKPLNLEDSEENTCSSIDARWAWQADKLPDPPSHWLTDISPCCLQDITPATNAIRSLTTLNHNRLQSAFAEVFPKTPGFVGDGIMRRSFGKIDVIKPASSQLAEKEDEEDLLTSERTHFHPIKSGAETSQNVVSYANGITFPINSDYDDVKFNRSSSGTMFLDSDTDTPIQYMEYRKTGIDYSRLDICVSSACSDEGFDRSSDLVLKFKVCQNDQPTQTNRGDLALDSTSRNCCLHSADSLENKPDIALDTDNELESLQEDWIQCDDCKLNDSWVRNDWRLNPRFNPNKIWSSDESVCQACSDRRAEAKAKRNDKKNKVYSEESAKEWDELLSDISFVQRRNLYEESDPSFHSSPSDSCYIAPTEISFSAADGNFIKSALMAQNQSIDTMEDVRAWLQRLGRKKQSTTVGSILDNSLMLYRQCEGCEEVGRAARALGGDRKRRHSAAGGRGGGKLRCTLTQPRPPAPPPPPSISANERPLTR